MKPLYGRVYPLPEIVKEASLKSVELFAGAGGLALGCAQAGFSASHVLEWDRWACDTLRENKRNGFSALVDTRIIEGDVREFDWTGIRGVDLVAGGPPCQPFSMGGKSKAFEDARDMFPAAVDVVSKLKPRAFVFENVRGLTRKTFADYFDYILARLRQPALVKQDEERWLDHWNRLKQVSPRDESGYRVQHALLNAADYGVPQQRHRVFFVGFDGSVEGDWNAPEPTHSYDALLWDQWVTGAYWDRHRVPRSSRPELTTASASRVRRLRSDGWSGGLRPWKTVRDALSDLPDPESPSAREFYNHVFQSGARSYPGHTGSTYDLPAKTLKAGTHGVPGGENMLRMSDSAVRYFTVRESAVLQTFPNNYEFHGSWGETMRQLGNAVPVLLAETVALSVRTLLSAVINAPSGGSSLFRPENIACAK